MPEIDTSAAVEFDPLGIFPLNTDLAKEEFMRAGGRVLTPTRVNDSLAQLCAGTCDTDVNRCLCGPGSRFPHRPMVHCQYDGVERDMPWQTPQWAGFAHAPKSAFWTPGGAHLASRAPGAVVAWCDADPDLRQRPAVACKCYDGQSAERLLAEIGPAR